jgi:hypothetical protein
LSFGGGGSAVGLTEHQKEQLFAGLEARGWSLREGFVYAPHGTMWLSHSQPWSADLRDFHERMAGRLQRNMQAGGMYEDPAEHQRLVADTRGLVEALAELLAVPDAEPPAAPDRPRD